jgi:hypothetical protein
MEAAFLQFFVASTDCPAVHVAQGLKQCGVKLHRIVGFTNGEFRRRGIKLQLQPLQEDGMVDAALRTTPAQYAVSKDQLYSLPFPVDPA